MKRIEAALLHPQVTDASRDVSDYIYRTRADGKLISRLSKHSEVVLVSHGVSDDVVVGSDSSSVGGGLNSDGMSVGTDSAVTADSHLSSSGSNSSKVVEGLSVEVMHVGVVPDGLDHLGVGVAAVGNTSGMDAGLPVLFGIVHSVDVDFVPVSGTAEGACSLGDHAAGVPPGLEGSGLVGVGDVQRSESEFVVPHGLESVVPGKSHSVAGDSVGADGGVVSSDPGSEHSVESLDDSLVGSSSVLGVEVVVGSDGSDVDELHVSLHESRSGTLGLSEGFHGVEEGHVTELSTGGSSDESGVVSNSSDSAVIVGGGVGAVGEAGASVGLDHGVASIHTGLTALDSMGGSFAQVSASSAETDGLVLELEGAASLSSLGREFVDFASAVLLGDTADSHLASLSAGDHLVGTDSPVVAAVTLGFAHGSAGTGVSDGTHLTGGDEG